MIGQTISHYASSRN